MGCINWQTRMWSVWLGVVLFASGLMPVWAVEHHALIIGNAVYRGEKSLKNTLNDAQDMAAKLKELSFKVTVLENADGDTMRVSISEFLDRIRNSSGMVVLFYSGHGMQDRHKNNYLIPVNAQIRRESHIRAKGVGLNGILSELEDRPRGAVSLVILDACRNNPFLSRAKGGNKGLARVSTPPGGTLVLYATSPGKIADDNPVERNGLFTKHLLAYLFKPGMDIEDAFDYAARAVEKVDREQVPYKEGNLLGKYCLSGKPCGASTPNPRRTLELRYWDSTEKCNKPSCYRAYLEKYPQGEFVALAKAWLNVNKSPQSCCQLSVKATPSDARVRIMSIVPTYQDGIKLKPGKHRIRVERKGYQVYDQRIEVNQTEQVVMVDLKKIDDTPVKPPPVKEKPAISKPVKEKPTISASATNHVPVALQNPKQADLDLWKSIDRNKKEDLQKYLDQFPEGDYADLARLRLNKKMNVASVESPSVKVNVPEASANSEPAPVKDSKQADLKLWQTINQSNKKDLQKYLTQFPEGIFAGLARHKLNQ